MSEQVESGRAQTLKGSVLKVEAVMSNLGEI